MGILPIHATRPWQVRTREQSRDRRLMPGEEARFFAALEQCLDQTLCDLVWMLLLTGQRKGSVLAMRWEDIDLVAREWRIPDTKNGQPMRVPLTDRELGILKDRRLTTEASPWVFPAARGAGHLVSPHKAWDRLRASAGVPDLRIHDLRRTHGSWLADDGASLPLIGKALGHKSTAATMVYSRIDTNPVRKAKESALAGVLRKA